MAEKITIAELNVNSEAFLKAAEQTKIAIDKITLSQQKLEAQGKKNGQEYIKNEAQLKNLNSTFTQQKNAINAMKTPYAKLSRTLIIARNNAKNLAAEFGVNSKQARAATKEVNKLDKQLKNIDNSVGQNQRSVGKYGNALKGLTSSFLGITAVIYGFVRGLKSIFNTIVDFDKQLIAVGKTTNLSKEELSNFGSEVIDLGRKLKGISTQGLLETAEVAGQLGIRGSENILKFAETIQKLGLTSDIIGQDAARSFAKFIEVSSDSVENADRLGSVITQLGNNFATTEGEILANTTEIQKGIAIYNTSAQGVIALGAATSALGSKAEVSRGAFQKVFKVLNDGATTGKNLEKILSLTGQTQADFVSEFSTDAISTFQKFIKGLSDSSDKGINLSNTLNSLGLNQLRVSAVVGSLAKNYDVLEGALAQANAEYKTNTALNTEAEAASKSLSSIIGDTGDAWDNLTLSIEKGDGALAGFTKSAVISVGELFDALNDISVVSEENGNFITNFFKAFFSPDAEKAMKVQAEQIKQNKTLLKERKKLLDIVISENKAAGEYETQLEFRRRRIAKLSAQEVRDELAAIEKVAAAKKKAKNILDKEAEAKLKKAEEKTAEQIKKDKKAREAEQNQRLKDKDTFEQKKLKIENEAALRSLNSKIEKDKLKIDQEAKSQKIAIDKLLVSEAEKNNLKKQIDLAATSEKEQLEKDRIVKFEQDKQNLLNEIELQQAATKEEKDAIKLQQDLDKHLLELENLNLTITEKNELKKLLEQQFQNELTEIKVSASKKQLEADLKVTDSEKRNAQIRVSVARSLANMLGGLLGDSLSAKLASIAIDAAIQAGLVKIEGAATSGRISASVAAANAGALATPAAIASFGLSAIPVIAANTAVGAASQAQNSIGTSTAISNILTGAAIQGIGAVGQSFYDGGKIGGEANIPTSMRNKGGDDVLIQAKRGEVILNNEQQQRAGGAAFFSSIGVPGFANGGQIDTPSSITTPIQNSGKFNEQFEMLAQRINDIKVVGYVDDITDLQGMKVEIVSGANV